MRRGFCPFFGFSCLSKAGLLFNKTNKPFVAPYRVKRDINLQEVHEVAKGGRRREFRAGES